jgi:hypothetical protein
VEETRGVEGEARLVLLVRLDRLVRLVHRVSMLEQCRKRGVLDLGEKDKRDLDQTWKAQRRKDEWNEVQLNN